MFTELSTSPSLTDNFRAFEHTITRFTTTLLPLHQLGATMPDDKYSLILIHSLAHASMIRLHEPFLDDQVSRDVALRAARSVTVVAKHIADGDFDYWDPLIGVSAHYVHVSITFPDIPCPFPSALLGLCRPGTHFRASSAADFLATCEHS